MDYFTHISGSRPLYRDTDVVEWVELVEAVELFTPAPETSRAPLVGEGTARAAQSVSGIGLSGRSPIGGVHG